jgi:hypothetical protein
LRIILELTKTDAEDQTMRRASFFRVAGALLLTGAASFLWAQAPEGAPPYSQAPPDTGIDQTVARVSYVDGSVSYARGDDPDQWQGLDPNVPMTIGDRVYTDQAGTIELELVHGGRVEVGPQTDLTAVNMTDQVQQFALNSGVSSFAVRHLPQGSVYEVDTPNAAVTFEQNGLYRVDVDPQGQTRLTVHNGSATIAAGGGQLGVSSGEAIEIQGTDNPRYDVVAPAPPDRWDSFVDSRVRTIRAPNSPSSHYVSTAVVGAGDLDHYGTWQSVPGYGYAWAPSGVAAGWAPYQVGRWYWQDPWGWTWVSTEPWGWAPYHYGRWVTVSSRWFWVPVAPAVRTVAYAPALVAFVGGPPAVGVAVGAPGFVGWFPLAPRDPLIPWWGVRPAVNVNVTNVTYVNRTYVTVVQQTTFVTGAAVSAAVVRDAATVRQVAAAPVVVGRVPVLPTAASIRVAARPAAATAPPAAIASRTVVTRSAPPPAPPTFQQKLAVIQENKAPVANRAAAPAASAAARPIVAAKPVTSTSGSVQLAPRSAQPAQNAKRVEPVTAAPPRSAAAAPSNERAVARPPVREAPVNPGQPAVAEPPPAGRAPVRSPAPANSSNVERAERAPAQRVTPRHVPAPTRAAPPPEPKGRTEAAPAPESRERSEAAPPRNESTAQRNEAAPSRQGGPPPKATAAHGKNERKNPPHRPTPKPEKPE